MKQIHYRPGGRMLLSENFTVKRYATKVCRGAIVGILLFNAPAAKAENWPQWRGPTDDGISKETNLPAEWGESKNILWKLKLPGQSGATPAIWNDRIFLTSQEGDDVVLMCIGTDGKERWKRKLASGK